MEVEVVKVRGGRGVVGKGGKWINSSFSNVIEVKIKLED